MTFYGYAMHLAPCAMRSSNHGREAYRTAFEKERKFTDRALWQAEIGKPKSKPNKEVAEPCTGLLEGLFQEMERSSQDSFTLSTRFECQKIESDPKSPNWVPYTFYLSCQNLFPFAPTSPVVMSGKRKSLDYV